MHYPRLTVDKQSVQNWGGNKIFIRISTCDNKCKVNEVSREMSTLSLFSNTVTATKTMPTLCIPIVLRKKYKKDAKAKKPLKIKLKECSIENEAWLVTLYEFISDIITFIKQIFWCLIFIKYYQWLEQYFVLMTSGYLVMFVKKL